jgi:hypothetical protein
MKKYIILAIIAIIIGLIIDHSIIESDLPWWLKMILLD